MGLRAARRELRRHVVVGGNIGANDPRVAFVYPFTDATEPWVKEQKLPVPNDSAESGDLPPPMAMSDEVIVAEMSLGNVEGFGTAGGLHGCQRVLPELYLDSLRPSDSLAYLSMNRCVSNSADNPTSETAMTSSYPATWISHPPRRWRDAAFTLLELILVVVILAVLAAIIVPEYQGRELEASANTMAAVVQDVRSRIQLEYTENGAYPASIDPAWFDRLVNVFGEGGNVDSVFVANNPTHIYPANKTVAATAAHSMWYNRGNGAFCVRVRPQANDAESMALFNRVNGGSITAMSQRN